MDDRLRADKLDALQRAVRPFELPREVPLTAAAVPNRRLTRIRGIGTRDKDANPAPGQKDQPPPHEDLLIGLYGHRLPIAFSVEHSGSEIAIHLGTWKPGEGPDT